MDKYVNIRDSDMLGKFIGKRVVDITQHDEEDWVERGESYVQIMFEDGMYVRFNIGDEGFEYCDGE